MKYDFWQSLPAMFFEQAAALGDKPFLWDKRGGEWRPVTWREAAADAAAIAKALRGLGVAPGDRIMLVSESRVEWPLADIAIMASGALAVPAYVTNSTADHLHVLTNSGAKGAIVSTAALAARLLPAARQAPDLEFVIALEPLTETPRDGLSLHLWRDLLAEAGNAVEEVTAWCAAARRSDTCCLIYTSGTGGVPKGVMLSHGAILSNCKGAFRLLLELGLEDEIFLSFLPLSHSYEHTAGLYFPISIGAQIYYAEGVERLAANMAEVRPTIMTAVPRLYEIMHGRIMQGVRKAGGLRQRLFMKAVEIGRRRYEDASSLGLGDRLLDLVLDRLVRDKVRAQFGGRLKALVSGGAPLNYDVGVFFIALGLRLLQGYGQTESAPVVSCNLPGRVRIDTVGPPMVDVEVRIAEDGEILVRGELVMKGYWRDEAATAAVLRDGWLHTGDVGEIDPDGYIRITDRKKDIIVNSGGDNIAPQRVEGFLTIQPEISQAMVFGDRRPHLVALIVPDPLFAAAWARSHGAPTDVTALVANPAFLDAMGAAVARVNDELSVVERVRKFTLTAEPFSLENGMMTPSLKIRRHKILERYRGELEALYAR